MTQITRVLLVEDDPADHLLVQRLLERAGDSRDGLELEHVTHLQGALDRLGKGDVDVVLLDLNLPDSTGVGTVTRLREHDSETPVVVFTVAGDDETALRALRAGAQDYLPKGELTAPLLRRSIRYAAERRRMEIERERLRSLLVGAEKRESLCVFGAAAAFGLHRLVGEALEFADRGMDAVGAGRQTEALRSFCSVRRTAVRISDLGDCLRDYAVPRPLAMVPLDLSVFVAEASGFLEVLASPEVRFDYDLTRDLPPARADERRLRQLLTNFVINASEAIGDRPGRIAVSTGRLDATADLLADAEGAAGLRPGSCLFLRVADDGRYVEPEVRRRLFDPFFTTKFVGRGLGLSAALGIARQHGGAIHVASSRPGGTTFTLLLPDDGDGPASREAIRDAAPTAGGGSLPLQRSGTAD